MELCNFPQNTVCLDDDITTNTNTHFPFLFSHLMFIRTIISSVDRDASSSAMNELLMLT